MTLLKYFTQRRPCSYGPDIILKQTEQGFPTLDEIKALTLCDMQIRIDLSV